MGNRNRVGAAVVASPKSKALGAVSPDTGWRVLFNAGLERAAVTIKAIPVWIWLVSLGMITRLLNLGIERLWYDEAFTARLVGPGTDFWSAVTGDTHPPLWNIIQWVNVRILGYSEYALRLPAAILGILVILIIWRLALQIGFKPRTAITAAVLVALMPSAIYFSQDDRMYALLAFSVLFALWMAIRGNWYLFFFASVVAAYTQNVGLIYVTLIGLAALATSKIVDKAKGAIALSLVWLCWAPWAIVALQQASVLKSGGFWTPAVTVAGAFWPFILDSIGWRIPDPLQLHIYMAFVGLSLVGLITARWWFFTRGGFIYFVALAIVPLALALFSVLVLNVYVFRALLPSGLLLALPWAFALQHLSLFNSRVALGIIGACLAIAMLSYYLPGTNSREDIKAWVEPVAATSDPVFYLNASDEVQYGLYLNNAGYVMPSTGNMISITQQVRVAFGMRFRNLNAVPGQAVWIIFTKSPFSDVRKLAIWQELLKQPGIRLIKAHNSKLITTYLLRYSR